jgi:hypothetical protein
LRNKFLLFLDAKLLPRNISANCAKLLYEVFLTIDKTFALLRFIARLKIIILIHKDNNIDFKDSFRKNFLGFLEDVLWFSLVSQYWLRQTFLFERLQLPFVLHFLPKSGTFYLKVAFGCRNGSFHSTPSWSHGCDGA